MLLQTCIPQCAALRTLITSWQPHIVTTHTHLPTSLIISNRITPGFTSIPWRGLFDRPTQFRVDSRKFFTQEKRLRYDYLKFIILTKILLTFPKKFNKLNSNVKSYIVLRISDQTGCARLFPWRTRGEDGGRASFGGREAWGKGGWAWLHNTIV